MTAWRQHGLERASPTHSSSTCFIRRDTLPTSLVMRVLHRQREHSKSMQKLVRLTKIMKAEAPSMGHLWWEMMVKSAHLNEEKLGIIQKQIRSGMQIV